MTIEPRFRARAEAVHCPAPPSGLRRGPAGIVAIATAIAFLAFASPSLADTGSVYFDANNNVGAGHDFFGGTAPSQNLNVGVGFSVMPSLTSGAANVAIGDGTLSDNTLGNENVASGYNALTSNVNGGSNVATGALTLVSNTSGNNNVADGAQALRLNTTGNNSSATGLGALEGNSSGHDNTAGGFNALHANTTGDRNLALGSGAGSNLTTGSDNVDLVNAGRAGESGAIRIGNASRQTRAFLAGVSGTSIPGPTQIVRVNANGQLGTATAASELGSERQAASAVGKLKAHVRRQDREIATLKREVAKLSRG
jgi:hypothetical protein